MSQWVLLASVLPPVVHRRVCVVVDGAAYSAFCMLQVCYVCKIPPAISWLHVPLECTVPQHGHLVCPDFFVSKLSTCQPPLLVKSVCSLAGLARYFTVRYIFIELQQVAEVFVSCIAGDTCFPVHVWLARCPFRVVAGRSRGSTFVLWLSPHVFMIMLYFCMLKEHWLA